MKAKSLQPYVPPGQRRRRRRVRLRDVAVAIIGLELGVLAAVGVYMMETDTMIRVSFETRRADDAAASGGRLVIPVAGVRAEQLTSSFGARRGARREHVGIDIAAAEGTPVLAADRGVVVGQDTTGPGGRSIYQRGDDARTMYYYAHLSRFEPGLGPGDVVRAGDVIGYVGQTGNADTPHLHFAVYTITDPNRWRRGRHLDPYALLTGAVGTRTEPRP